MTAGTGTATGAGAGAGAGADARRVVAARNAVIAVFALNGVLSASVVSRVPDIRSGLGLSNGALGLLLLAAAVGSIAALPSAGWLIGRSSASGVVRLGAMLCLVGLFVTGLGLPLHSVAVSAVGLCLHGAGISVWDVAMNVEGAEVERLLARSIMPRFHGLFSVGAIVGAGIGIPMAAVHAPVALHLGLAGLLALGVTLAVTRDFLPAEERHEQATAARSAWLEPRTLALGVMLLAFGVVEGSANDWLSLALIDGYSVAHWVGVAGYAVFVVAMTTGRLVGPVVIDRFGRAPVLWATAALAAAGILLVVYGSVAALVGFGLLVWGLGASLGFPIGMSAATDDPARAAARLSVVATLGYGAFLAGPPLLGWLGDRVGTLDSLLAVAALMIPAAFAVLAAGQPSPSDQP